MGMYEEGYLDAKDEYERVTNYQKVREFQDAMGMAQDVIKGSGGHIELRWSLLEEEVHELYKELFNHRYGDPTQPDVVNIHFDREKAAKEIADVLYVTYGMAAAFGIDIDRVFDEVHKSNMSKLGEDGKPIYREDGKVLKGPNYQPPKLEFIHK